MGDKAFLVHGWSVTETTTYQALHLRLAAHGYELNEIYLGRYVSLDNEVEITDIAKAMHKALLEHLGNPPWTTPFHLITHSTGALVVKDWVVRWYTGKCCRSKALKNLVFLAGPHFGSRLAHHGRSMLAQVAYFGDTGKRVLVSLELGSEFSWQNNGAWLDPASWKQKGIRPYCIIGDRVKRSLFKSRIFPAGYEEGSDMVVRVPAGNLNFRRFRLDASKRLVPLGAIQEVPFAALGDYLHSGDDAGIMNSIKRKSTPGNHQALRLLLRCLGVKTTAQYKKVREELNTVTKRTRTRQKAPRQAFAQLDFRFITEDGSSVDDYRFALGAIVDGHNRASKTVVHTHKNNVAPNHFTAFLNLKEFEPQLTYFLEFDARTDTELFKFVPDPYRVKVSGRRLKEIVSADQVTQIDVQLVREPSKNLFRFHAGTDPDLHVEWNRDGEITDRKLEVK